MTLVPLFLFTLGFKLIGIGPASMILFLTPTSQFILGVFFFNEILTFEKLLGFIKSYPETLSLDVINTFLKEKKHSQKIN